jgi:AraC-like DNA-binding protein
VNSEHLSDLILESLDREAGTGDLARAAYQSRSQFYRLFQALIAENPGRMRRRLLLERAAWQLSSTGRPVTEIALDAQYGSLEAFTRAFRGAFQTSPSLYRRSGSSRIHLPAPNHYHFCPSGRQSKGVFKNMELFELFSGTDSWYTRRLLEQAESLDDEQLDRPLNGTAKVWGWDQPDRNLREILERMVQTKEVWAAALTGGDMPELDNRPATDRTPAAMRLRFENAEADFERVLRDVGRRGAWDETFVDALCEPAETFSYGGMFAHVMTFNAWRRLAALDAFQKLGAPVSGTGCPMEYEAAFASRERCQ